MNPRNYTRHIALALVLALFVLMPGIVTPIAHAQGSGEAATDTWVWDLAEDFRVYPKQTNPNPDSYGNPEIWSFLYSTTAHDPSTYALNTEFLPNVLQHPGMQGWLGLEQSSPLPNDRHPRVSMNTTGIPMPIQPGASLPPAIIEVHPASSQPAIVGWHSPFTGVIAIAGGVAALNSQCGDGIQWAIDKNSTTIAQGSYPLGGSQLFQDGTNGAQLANVGVTQGDFIYFLVAPGGDYRCDWTQLDVAITAVSLGKPPAPTLQSPANGATGLPATVTLDWSDVPFATSYKVVVKHDASRTVTSVTVFEVSKLKLRLPQHGSYHWNVKACNSGGCSKSETWTFEK